MEKPLSRSLLLSIEDASGPKLKDVLRRIEARSTGSGSRYHNLTRTADLADLVKETCALDGSCISIVEKVFRANEKEKSHLREILLDSD